MESTYFKDFEVAARQAQCVFGVNFTVAGDSTVYRGVRNDLAMLDPLVSGGFLQQYKLSLSVIASDVNPKIGTIITVDGVQLRVKDKADSTEDPEVVLYLQGVNQ